jgi:hypothetical protein
VQYTLAADWSYAGFSWLFVAEGELLSVRAFGMPYWFITATFALLPALRIVRYFLSKEKFMFQCPTCGYDLRATPDRCPECGKTAKASIPAEQIPI